MAEEDFLDDLIDTDKTIAFIRAYLPQDLQATFSDDDLNYMLDVMDEYYVESGILDAEPDAEGFVDIDLEKVADYIVRQAKADGIGDFATDDVLFVVQGEMEYGESIGAVE
jgi:hypothetical protein